MPQGMLQEFHPLQFDQPPSTVFELKGNRKRIEKMESKFLEQIVVNNGWQLYSPGQGREVHDIDWLDEPGQDLPPCAGAGEVQLL